MDTGNSLLTDHDLASIASRYTSDDNNVGILLFGSSLGQNFDKFSDIDIYVITKATGAIEREQFIHEDLVVDALFDSVDKVDQYLKEETNNVSRNVSQMLSGSKVILSRDQEITRLISDAEKNLATKTTYTEKEITLHKYSIKDFLTDAKRETGKKDLITFNNYSASLIQNVVELALKLNGEYLRKPPELTKILNQLHPELTKTLNDFYLANDTDKKMMNLESIAQYAWKISGGPLPGEWQVQANQPKKNL